MTSRNAALASCFLAPVGGQTASFYTIIAPEKPHALGELACGPKVPLYPKRDCWFECPFSPPAFRFVSTVHKMMGAVGWCFFSCLAAYPSLCLSLSVSLLFVSLSVSLPISLSLCLYVSLSLSLSLVHTAYIFSPAGVSLFGSRWGSRFKSVLRSVAQQNSRNPAHLSKSRGRSVLTQHTYMHAHLWCVDVKLLRLCPKILEEHRRARSNAEIVAVRGLARLICGDTFSVVHLYHARPLTVHALPHFPSPAFCPCTAQSYGRGGERTGGRRRPHRGAGRRRGRERLPAKSTTC